MLEDVIAAVFYFLLVGIIPVAAFGSAVADIRNTIIISIYAFLSVAVAIAMWFMVNNYDSTLEKSVFLFVSAGVCTIVCMILTTHFAPDDGESPFWVRLFIGPALSAAVLILVVRFVLLPDVNALWLLLLIGGANVGVAIAVFRMI